MATPPTAATYSGGLSTPFETRPTTRVTDELERMMAQALNNSGASTVPDRRASRRGRAAVRESHDLRARRRPDRNTQGPTAQLGRTDGSCPGLAPPTEKNPTARRRPREPLRANRIPT
jgi:hypothetical protein